MHRTATDWFRINLSLFVLCCTDVYAKYVVEVDINKIKIENKQ